MKKTLLIILMVVLVIVGCLPWVYSTVKAIQFEALCGDYLELAADANDVEVAEKHLTTAIEYLEDNNLTKGYTKIFVYKPTNDIGLWYENLKTAQEQLRDLQDKEVTELEESNALMKMRETLLDTDGFITAPDGISVADHYTLIFWLNLLFFIPCWAAAFFIWLLSDAFY